MRRIYGILLRLYPQSHRTSFGGEMSAAFAQSLEDSRGKGWIALARFLTGELSGLLAGAVAAWLSGKPADAPVDLTRMRPPGVPRESYATAVDEVLAAQKLVDFNVHRMQRALAAHAFVEARFYSDEDRRARQNLRIVRERYNISE